MNQLMSFTPLMRSSIGFDRFSDLFESLVEGAEKQFEAYPPYNIEKNDEDRYRIVMAVAGFTLNDLTITAQGDSLLVSGKMEDKKDGETQYLHRGIANRAFQRSFRLADHIRVVDADMRDGLLTINLVREIPEEAKPRTISIRGLEPRALENGKKH